MGVRDDLISGLPACTERPDIRSQFNSVLYQLLLDPSERVCFEAILCVLGKYDSSERCDLYDIIFVYLLLLSSHFLIFLWIGYKFNIRIYAIKELL